MFTNIKMKFNNIFFDFSLFSIYGFFANAISFCIYFTNINLFDLKYTTAYLIATITVIIVNFFFYLKIFKTLYNIKRLIRYIVAQFILFIVHLSLIIILVEFFFQNEIFSHILSNILLSIIIFFVYKFFIFNKDN